MWPSREVLTGGDLCRSRPVALHVEMGYLLSQQALQEGFSQSICCSRSCNAYAHCCHVADDEACNEQIHKVENQLVDAGLELLRIALASGVVTERACRRAEDQRH